MKAYSLPTYPATRDVWDLLRQETRPLVVYGMGNGADKLLAECDARGIAIADFMASDGFVRGQSFHGKTVLSLASVKEKYSDFVLVLAFASSRPEVLEMLWELAETYPLIMPDLPVVGKTCFDKEFYNAHYADFSRIMSGFADSVSCNLYAAVLQYKLTGDILILRDAYTDAASAQALLQPETVETYIDLGAYRGDTLAEQVAVSPRLQRAVCVEPDRRSYAKLAAYAETLTDKEVRCVHAAVGDTDGVATLAASGNRNSSLVGASYENRAEEVALVTVDTLCDGLLPDYIKYDVEGAELPALLGSALTISRARPIILLSLYHRTEDMIDLADALRALCPDYDFYLRRPACVPAWELNLIAVPQERKQ